MNGRIYDPLLGRFLSADPYVGDAYDSQDYNRYSYVGNNPLNANDPSGFFKLKDALKIVAVVVVAYFTAGAALWAMGYGTLTAAGTAGAAFGGTLFGAAANIGAATLGAAIASGAAAGFASGFAGSLLNGGSIGDAFKAGVIGGIAGGISAGLFHGIGAGLEGMENLTTFEREGLRALGHGVVGGGMEEAMGGQFRHGFYAGAATAAGSFGIAKYGRNWGVAGRTAAAAVVGGTASAIGGGKFANGAVTGAFSHLFNSELSKKEMETAKRTYGEVGSLRPTEDEGPGDPNSLNEATRKIAGIAYDSPSRVSPPLEPDLRDPTTQRIFTDIQGAVQTRIDPGTEKHFVIWPSTDGGKTPAPGMSAKWPYTQTGKISSVYGPFKTTWPRDAADRYIFFYDGVK